MCLLTARTETGAPSRRERRADGVLLLHSGARPSASMRALQRAPEAAGHPVLNLDYRSRHLPPGADGDPIHPAVSRFADATHGALHVVAHSRGGLLPRAYLAGRRPARLGRVVMLGMPNGSSELVDLLRGWALHRAAFGPAGQQVSTAQGPDLRAALGAVDDDLGIPAGDRPLNPLAAALLLPGPSDGEVTVASTRLAAMADHRVVHTSRTRLVSHPEAVAAALRFLREGAFAAAP